LQSDLPPCILCGTMPVIRHGLMWCCDCPNCGAGVEPQHTREAALDAWRDEMRPPEQLSMIHELTGHLETF